MLCVVSLPSCAPAQQHSTLPPPRPHARACCALPQKEEEAEAAAEEVEAMRARQAALAAQLERHQTELAAQQEMAEKVRGSRAQSVME